MQNIDQLDSDVCLHEYAAAWDFIQEAILIGDHCDLNAKSFYLQHPDSEPYPTAIVQVIRIKLGHCNTQVMAQVLCDDGITRECIATRWWDAGSYWQPPDSGYDFEWINDPQESY